MSTQKNQTKPEKTAAQQTETQQTETQPLPIELDVRINSIVPNSENKQRATASVNMNGCFAVRGAKVIEGPKGLFVAMPSYKSGSGEFKDYCHPVTKEFREQLNDAVLAAYKQATAKMAPVPAVGQQETEASPMKVDVRITAFTPSSENQRATASANLNDSFALKGIKIMEGENGLFVSTPGYNSGDEYKEHYFPTTKDFREQLHGAVLAAYDAAITQMQETAGQDAAEQGNMAQAM